jgi:hypothetical protein
MRRASATPLGLSSSSGQGEAAVGTSGSLGDGGTGIVPEKALLGHTVRSSVPAQFWGNNVSSSAVPDASLALAASSQGPLPLLAGSGLSRPHLVLAAQAVPMPKRALLPGMPSWSGDQGGLVRPTLTSSAEAVWPRLEDRLPGRLP